MSYAIETEIEGFKNRINQLSKRLDIKEECELGYIIKPQNTIMGPSPKIALTIAAIIHGNEVAGVAVLNSLLDRIIAGMIELSVPLALVLGNSKAALANRRFIDRDLNRTFGRISSVNGSQHPESFEETRARELQRILANTQYLLDIHQTNRPSDRAFFIFPYRSSALEFAFALNPRSTVVTHWGNPFSQEGQCSDEFVNGNGGLGITLELGQNGFDPFQIALGVDAASWAIYQVTYRILHQKWYTFDTSASPSGQRSEIKSEIYTWSRIVPWPQDGSKVKYVELIPGLNNFGLVEKDQIIGYADGDPIVAPVSGKILFPKYLSREDQFRSTKARPTELLRIMKPCNISDLPA